MWVVSFAKVFTLAVSSLGAGSEPAVAPKGPPEPIATRQTFFSIPFRLDRSDPSAPLPLEVQLLVSADGGKTWKPYHRVGPAETRFLFRAHGDGEYWFLIRTLDPSGRLRPEKTEKPGLRVVVDTTPPGLKLQAWQGEAGQVVAQWEVDELHPDPQSLKIHCRADANDPWQPLAIDRQGMNAPGPTRTGQVVWWPQAGSGNVEIRAEVADIAENRAVSHAHVVLGGDPASVAFPNPDATREADTDREPTAESAEAQWRPSPEPSPPMPRQTAPAGSESLPQDRLAAEQPAHVEINPAFRDRYVPPSPQASETSDLTVPTGERPRMVDSRLFELEYSVDSVGPSGIDRVELWGTRDGGQTWFSFGTDDDKRSPMLVAVTEEGVYGFRVVVQNGLGMGGEAPRSGEVPDIWIGVDLSKPDARIVSAEPGTGPQAGRLIIRWEAGDRMLAARPVALFFGDTPGGPWSTIASGLENSGQYAWTVDRRVPERIYLRLEVRDEAGNLGVFETARAVSLQQPRPTVHIRDVRPVPSGR